MDGSSHRQTTYATVELLRRLPGGPDLTGVMSGLIEGVVELDHTHDLELVDVEGLPVGNAEDDPHRNEFWAIDDKPHYELFGRDLTSFCHFIDIGKGKGAFDDRDGYAHERGSGSHGQHQSLEDVTISDNPLSHLLQGMIAMLAPGWKVDDAVAWLLDDEYVHAPGSRWYRQCSPALANYCGSPDKREGWSLDEECRQRFPHPGSAIGHPGRGFPASVFPPIDNVGLHCFEAYASSKDPRQLGYVLHAIQDCVIPQHVSSHLGNWHVEFERDLDAFLPSILWQPSFADEVLALIRRWSAGTTPSLPGLDWRVDHLVTWLAQSTFDLTLRGREGSPEGYRFDETRGRELAKLAVAMGVFIAAKAHDWSQPASWSERRARLAIDSISIDFADCTRATRVVRITNNASEPIVLSAIRVPACRAFAIAAHSLPQTPVALNVGGSLELEISFERSITEEVKPAVVAGEIAEIVSSRSRSARSSVDDRLRLTAELVHALRALDDRIELSWDGTHGGRDNVYLHADALDVVPVRLPQGFPIAKVRRNPEPIPGKRWRGRSGEAPPPGMAMLAVSDMAHLLLAH